MEQPLKASRVKTKSFWTPGRGQLMIRSYLPSALGLLNLIFLPLLESSKIKLPLRYARVCFESDPWVMASCVAYG